MADDPWAEAWEPDDDVYAMFDDTGIDSLRALPDVESGDAAEVYDYMGEKHRAKVERIKDENEMRTKFFGWSSKLAGWVVGANIVIFVAYLIIQAVVPKAIPDSVMLSWIGSTVVETLGIVYIVARHLFPGKKWQNGNGIKH